MKSFNFNTHIFCRKVILKERKKPAEMIEKKKPAETIEKKIKLFWTRKMKKNQ